MPSLIAIEGALADREYLLGSESFAIGRESSNHLEVPDILASRKHCILEFIGLDVSGPRYRIRDLESANGTLVNGESVTSQELDPGDKIQIGDSVFVYSASKSISKSALNPTGIVMRSTVRLQSRDGRLDALLDAAEVFGSLDSPEAVCWALLDAIFGVLVAAERGAVIQSSQPVNESAWIVGRDRSGEIQPPVPISLTAVNQVISDATPLLSNEIASKDAPVNSGSVAARNVTALMAVPLLCGRRLTGVLYLESSAAGALFTEENLRFAAAMTSLASLAIESVTRFAHLRNENASLTRKTQMVHGLRGGSPKMTAVYRMISKVAPTLATVLVLGENGTGKELAARAIHAGSRRATKPFSAVNCAVLTEDLLASDLFGHEKGAFTGATVQRRGKLESAEGGTVFLDEIAEMSVACQAKLLRFLQEREFERVGGTSVIKSDVRIIAATHRDLAERVRQGIFRQDLYFRLNVVSIEMPALRERTEDIAMLASHFLTRFANICGRELQGFAPETMGLLESYDWPGNVRELENAIHRAAVLGSTDWVLPEDLPDEVQSAVPVRLSGRGYHAAVREARKHVVLDAFRQADGSHQEAARLLEIHPNNLHRLLRELDLRKIVSASKSSTT